MSYLDDPNHPWILDPNCTGLSFKELRKMMEDRDWDGWQLIFQGYAGLKLRYPEARDEDCLDTAMMWYYG